MGTTQPFRSSASWEQAIELLDTLFPLNSGSHGSVKGYMMHFDHLVVIQDDDQITSLKNPGQFVEAGGNFEAPTSILLEQNGLQVEIEPASHSASVCGCHSGHRMQLVTSIQAA